MRQQSNRLRFGPTTAEKLKLPAGEDRADFWDVTMPRFGVRVGRRRRVWMVRYRFDGEKRRDKLGFVGPPPRGMSLADARKKADAWLAKVDYGIDPRREAPPDLKGLTFDQLAEEYRKRHGGAKRSWKSDETRIKRDLSPAFGAKLAAAVTDADIEKVIDAMKARGVTVGATRTFETARALFRWAVKKKLIPRAPTDGMEAPFKTGKRKRYLDDGLEKDEAPRRNDSELARYWRAVAAVEDDGKTRRHTHARLLALMLLLGGRGGELRRAMWRDLDLERGIWRPKPERTKVERDYDLPLPARAVSLIEAQRGLSDVWVFPRLDGEPEPNASDADELNRELCAAAGIVDYRPHDSRHTVSTYLEAMGFDDLTVGAIVGHKRAGMTGRYSHYRREREMRVALEAWQRRLLTIAGEIAPEPNVREFSASRSGAA